MAARLLARVGKKAPTVEEYIGAEDPVRAYDAFVDALDFVQLGIEDDPYRVGAPQCDPRAMLKLLVYGYSYGIRSSRKLERATYHNVNFIWLMGGLKPDHKTIARFRRDQVAALKNVLKQCARVCLRLGLIEGNTLFVDGTKVRANASMKHTWTAERCQKSLGEIDRRIEAMLKECEKVDRSEETHGSSVQMQRALQDQEHLKAQIGGALAELQKLDKTALNTTDPESARVRNGGQIETGYNCQAVVDERHGLIVHSDVLNQSNDVGLFSEQIEGAQDTLGKVCKRAVADTGYSSPEDLQKSLDQNIDVVVPIHRCSDFRDHFSYDADQNSDRCPEGHVLRYAGVNNRNKSHMYSITDAAICQQCPRFGTCTRSRTGRRVERPFTEAIRERLEARYSLPDAPLLMRRRKMRAEHPFGHIKHNLGMRAFLMRGLGGVRTEMALAATAFNITRTIKLIGMAALIQRLNPSPA
jgi:transposase